MSVGQLSQLATDSNPLSSLWETFMSHLRHSTPAFTDPSPIASSINHPTVFHYTLGGGRWGTWTRGSRSTKRNPLSRAPMKRFAPAALEVIMHRLGSEPSSSSADEALILNLPFQAFSPSNSHSVCFVILMRGFLAHDVLGSAVTCAVHRAKR